MRRSPIGLDGNKTLLNGLAAAQGRDGEERPATHKAEIVDDPKRPSV
jgi:hypothetical protein